MTRRQKVEEDIRLKGKFAIDEVLADISTVTTTSAVQCPSSRRDVSKGPNLQYTIYPSVGITFREKESTLALMVT